MKSPHSTHVHTLPDVPAWLSVAAPAVIYPLLVALIFIHWPTYDLMMRKEGGIEYLAVVVLAVGIGHGLVLLLRWRTRLPRRWLRGWFALAVLGMLVFAGEELSWGQHLGLWDRQDVPEPIRNLNDQNETNLHNMTNALDQGPTNIIVVATFVAFVLLPLYLRARGETMDVDNPGYWFWPTRAGLVAAIGVLVIPFPKRIYEWTTGVEAETAWRHSEVHEFYIALLMTIYTISVYRRLRAMPMPSRRHRSRARLASVRWRGPGRPTEPMPLRR